MRLTGERTLGEQEVMGVVEKIHAGTVSKGAGIRELFAGGLAVKEIAAETGIRYNHVYNVVKNEILTKGLGDMVEKSARGGGNSKRSQILSLLQEGKTITEVSQELRCLYNYVWQVAKAAGLTGKGIKPAPVEEPAVEETEAPKVRRVRKGKDNV